LKSQPERGRTAAPAPAEDSPRAARRERRRAQSRDEIVEATRRVLLRDGIAATTLDAVAKEVGLTKAALYYYFRSKEALLFEVIFGVMSKHAHAVHDAVGSAKGGGEALRAIIRETVELFAQRIDDFRLVYLHGQVAAPGTLRVDPDHLARIRPLNDLAFATAAKMLEQDWTERPGRAGINPRLMAFLANVAAIGLLTFKGMVESVDDPLLYSDEELIEGFARIFEAAAAPYSGAQLP
jgi:AcrR family transcriptional regulator